MRVYVPHPHLVSGNNYWAQITFQQKCMIYACYRNWKYMHNIISSRQVQNGCSLPSCVKCGLILLIWYLRSIRIASSYRKMYYKAISILFLNRRNWTLDLVKMIHPSSWILLVLEISLEHSGIYLHEIKLKLSQEFRVEVSVSIICGTLKDMWCSHQHIHIVSIQQSDYLRGTFMAEVSK